MKLFAALRISLGLLLSLSAVTAAAQLAYYVDENGRRVYVNAEPKPVVFQPAASTGKQIPNAKRKVTVTFAAPAPVAYSKDIAKDMKIDTLVEETARRHDVDASLVKAVMKQESNNNPRAVSNKGAQGLMQLMPPTARDLGVTNTFDPAQNIDGGVRYLKHLLTLYRGDLPLSLAAYNAGPAAVERHGGIPPYRETRNYVKRIGDLYTSLKSRVTEQERPKQGGIVKTTDESGRVLYTNLR